MGFYVNFNFLLFVDGRFKLLGCLEGFECWFRGVDKGFLGL